jgi:hypothetical protein
MNIFGKAYPIALPIGMDNVEIAVAIPLYINY